MPARQETLCSLIPAQDSNDVSLQQAKLVSAETEGRHGWCDYELELIFFFFLCSEKNMWKASTGVSLRETLLVTHTTEDGFCLHSVFSLLFYTISYRKCRTEKGKKKKNPNKTFLPNQLSACCEWQPVYRQQQEKAAENVTLLFFSGGYLTSIFFSLF